MSPSNHGHSPNPGAREGEPRHTSGADSEREGKVREGKREEIGTREREDTCDSCPELGTERRKFLGAVIAGAGGAAGVALLVPWVGLFVTPLRRDGADAWLDVGSIEEFPVGETRKVVYRDASPLPWAGFAARSAAWVRRDGVADFAAFGSHCTHVGCVVRWEEEARLFFCPCHGGAFHADGSVAAGPPPRPLDRHPVRVRNGRIEIQPIGASDRST